MSLDSGIGDRLRAARVRRGLRRETLAVRAGISAAAIAQIESGRRRNVRPSTLAGLAGCLGVTIDHLVLGSPSTSPMLSHQALVYGTDEEFLKTAGPFLVEGRERGEASIAVTGNRNIELLREQLGSTASEVELVGNSGWYTSPGAALAAYTAFIESSIEKGAPWVRIVGEPVWGGRSRAETRLWTQYESLLNLVFSSFPASIICPYDKRTIASSVLRQAHHTHPGTISAGTMASSPDYVEPAEFVLGPKR
jgi:transcriptional regulator with XRE-family HTH domain